jgi:hypothetical protein
MAIGQKNQRNWKGIREEGRSLFVVNLTMIFNDSDRIASNEGMIR